MTREPIYAALFAKLKGTAGFVTASRRVKHWDDVPAAMQPALFVAQRHETAEPQPVGLPTRWVLELDVIVYARTPQGADESPAAIMNPILDALVAALAPNSPINTQTLGGLVDHCWIEGQISTDEGVLGDQSVAIVPVRILTS